MRALAGLENAAGPAALVSTRPVDGPVDPIAWFAAAWARFGEVAYIARPDRGSVIVGAGAVRDAATRLQCDDATAAAGGPLRVGGMAFDPAGPQEPVWQPFRARDLVVPRLTLRVCGDSTTVTAVHDGHTEADCAALLAAARPSATAAPLVLGRHATPADWRESVAAVADRVRAGTLEKVVLARRVAYDLDGDLDVPAALDTLTRAHPAATIYAFARADACFVGASPERLALVDRGRFEVDAVAGTAARGGDAASDEALARALFASEKERIEHDVVVRWVRAALAGVADTVNAAPEPRVRGLGNVQHLYTPIWGTTSRSVLDLVDRLHPTPAVAGVPRERALATIAACERFDRGWYAGPVGWTGASGDGEFSVALRCALVTPRSATLFAGAGIVGGSQPDAEVAETELKIGAMARALGIGA